MSNEDHYKKMLAGALKYNEDRGKTETKEETKAESLLPEISDEVPEGYRRMSEVFGVTAKGRDIPVRIRDTEEWAEHIRMFVPDKIEGYIWPVEELEAFLIGVDNRDKTLLHGEAGTGKSSLPEQVCAYLNIPFMRVNCREDMESSALFGSIHVEDGTISWIPGPAEELARHGGMLQIDEISAAPPGVNMAMQWMLEDNGKVFLADKPGKPKDKFVNPVDEFHIVATDNTRLQGDTSGAYAGTQVQNTAMLDRFTNIIEMDYPPKKAEEQMLTNRVPGIPKELSKKMVQVAGHVRAGFKEGSIQYPLSPRANIEWAKKILQTGDINKAFKHVYFMKLIDDDRRQVEGYYNRVFPDKLK
jgi:cobaltochelatase CobS